MTILLIIFYATIGLVVVISVATKRQLFWPVLIFVTVGAADLAVGQYQIVEQWLTLSAIFGAFLSILSCKGSLHDNKELGDSLRAFHIWIFNIMILYMMFQSLRGLLVLESVTAGRWVFYYGSLGVLSFLLTKKHFPVPNIGNFALIVSFATLFYLSQYFALVFITEIIHGTSRWVAQSQGWVGGAYSLFSLAVGMPAIIILLTGQKRLFRMIGWVTLTAAIGGALVAERRLAWIAIVLLLVISLRKFAAKRAIVIVIACVLAVVAYSTYSERPLGDELRRFSTEFSDTLSPIWEATRLSPSYEISEIRDVDRVIHLRVALERIGDNWATSLFGYGFRVGGFVIGPYLVEYYRAYLPHADINIEIGDVGNASTPGIPALFVDTGYLGVLLLLLNLFVVAYRIYLRKYNPNRWVLLISLVVLIAWLSGNNFLTYSLFYVAIMPEGILLQFSRFGSTDARIESAVQKLRPPPASARSAQR